MTSKKTDQTVILKRMLEEENAVRLLKDPLGIISPQIHKLDDVHFEHRVKAETPMSKITYSQLIYLRDNGDISEDDYQTTLDYTKRCEKLPLTRQSREFTSHFPSMPTKNKFKVLEAKDDDDDEEKIFSIPMKLLPLSKHKFQKNNNGSRQD